MNLSMSNSSIPIKKEDLPSSKPRVRFAPSPTGFLHVGSARTFIFNWLYARRNGGTMVLRLDDTDVERNTDASVQSIFEGLNWLNLGWDEDYKQSERLALHQKTAWDIFEKDLAYRDFTPAHTGDAEKSGAQGTWLFNPGVRELSRAESDRRAAAGEGPYMPIGHRAPGAEHLGHDHRPGRLLRLASGAGAAQSDMGRPQTRGRSRLRLAGHHALPLRRPGLHGVGHARPQEHA